MLQQNYSNYWRMETEVLTTNNNMFNNNYSSNRKVKATGSQKIFNGAEEIMHDHLNHHS